MRALVAACVCCVALMMGSTDAQAQKKFFRVSSLNGVNLDKGSSQWCWERSLQGDDFIIFWESGFGSNPSQATGSTAVDVNKLLATVERAFKVYSDSLGFVARGASKTDSLKMIVFLHYTATWMAYGSGQDNMIGSLDINYDAAHDDFTVAHEVGHCFQYQTHCDKGVYNCGFNYGYAPDGSGGNGWWEQCAQWQASVLFPARIEAPVTYKNFIHEDVRYRNFVIQWWWAYQYGLDFVGRMWRESQFKEDPADVYKRMRGIDQAQFNGEMYEACAHLAVWDAPVLSSVRKSFLPSALQPVLSHDSDGYWKIDSSQCVQNYGYNVIKLNPSQGADVKVCFQGLLSDGVVYRKIKQAYAGWRFGFVATRRDGTFLYGEMGEASYNYPTDTLSFHTPADCSELRLVVMGAPVIHFHHPWDNSTANDEQWPYRVKFEGTNLVGEYEPGTSEPHDSTLVVPLSFDIHTESSSYYYIDMGFLANTFCKSATDIVKELNEKTITYGAIDGATGELNTTPAYGTIYGFYKNGAVCALGDSLIAFITALQKSTNSLYYFVAPFGKVCSVTDTIRVEQCFVDTIQGKPYRATLQFVVTFYDPAAVKTVEEVTSSWSVCLEGDALIVPRKCATIALYDSAGRLVACGRQSDRIAGLSLARGLYLVQADGHACKFYKK